MARRRIPRFQPPPAAMSAAISSRISDMMAASSLSPPEASRLSAWAAQQAKSTSSADSDFESNASESTSATKVTLGDAVPAATTSDSSAVSTDSSGSTITRRSSTTGQVTAVSTSSTQPAIAVASDHASDSAYHNPGQTGPTVEASYHSGPSPGKIAAAVAIPVICLIALALGIWFLRRRRHRRNVAQENQTPYHHPMTDRSSKGGAAAFAKETGTFNKPRGNVPNGSAAPILTSATNNSYYTGLSTPTTPSRASTRTRGTSGDSTRPVTYYEPPPPAYVKNAPPGSTPSLPELSFTADPFMDPVSPTNSDHTSPTSAALAALTGRDTALTATSFSPGNNAVPRPDISRSGTMRSIASFNSDAYSDTASVHSARPARMSGAAQVTYHRTSEYAPGWVVDGEGNPFADRPK